MLRHEPPRVLRRLYTGCRTTITVSSRVTDKATGSRRLVFGVTSQDGEWSLLKDWQVLLALNECTLRAEPALALPGRPASIESWLQQARTAAPDLLRAADLPFSSIHIAELALLWTDA